jgi:hypothetical protein
LKSKKSEFSTKENAMKAHLFALALLAGLTASSTAFARVSENQGPDRTDQLLQMAESKLRGQGLEVNEEVSIELSKALGQIATEGKGIGAVQVADASGEVAGTAKYGCAMLNASASLWLGLRGAGAICTNFGEIRFITGFPVGIGAMGAHVGAGLFYLTAYDGALLNDGYACMFIGAALLGGIVGFECYTEKADKNTGRARHFVLAGLELGAGADGGLVYLNVK